MPPPVSLQRNCKMAMSEDVVPGLQTACGLAYILTGVSSAFEIYRLVIYCLLPLIQT